MAGLGPAIHASARWLPVEVMDARPKAGHDGAPDQGLTGAARVPHSRPDGRHLSMTRFPGFPLMHRHPEVRA